MSLPIDGSANDVIHCFKEGDPYEITAVHLKRANPFEVSNSDVENAPDPHLWIDSNQEDDNDQDVDVLFLVYWVLNVLFEFIAYWVFYE